MSAETTGAPRWVKICAVTAAVVVVLVAIVLVTGIGGSHGPSRHMPSSETQAPEVAP
jgi:hypothetical protein